jgi:hypothetical protein
VAIAATGVVKRPSFFRNKLPVVAFGMQGQLQDSESVGMTGFAVRSGSSDNPVRVLAVGADDEFADPMLRIGIPIGVLGREALVVLLAHSRSLWREGFDYDNYRLWRHVKIY